MGTTFAAYSDPVRLSRTRYTTENAPFPSGLASPTSSYSSLSFLGADDRERTSDSAARTSGSSSLVTSRMIDASSDLEEDEVPAESSTGGPDADEDGPALAFLSRADSFFLERADASTSPGASNAVTGVLRGFRGPAFSASAPASAFLEDAHPIASERARWPRPRVVYPRDASPIRFTAIPKNKLARFFASSETPSARDAARVRARARGGSVFSLARSREFARV